MTPWVKTLLNKVGMPEADPASLFVSQRCRIYQMAAAMRR